MTLRTFLLAIPLGAALGLWYDFLRPLGGNRPWGTDILFIAGAVYAWLYHSFALCRGDIRMWSLGAMGLGFALWEIAAGRAARFAFGYFWNFIRNILGQQS